MTFAMRPLLTLAWLRIWHKGLVSPIVLRLNGPLRAAIDALGGWRNIQARDLPHGPPIVARRS